MSLNLPRLVPNRFMTFDHTVRDICAYLGDQEAKVLYIPVARELKHALHALNLHVNKSCVKSVIVQISSNMTADLPDDIQTLSKVGVCCINGEIRLLGRNDSLCIPKDEDFFKCCDCNNGEESVSATTSTETSCCAACTFHNVDIQGSSFGTFNSFLSSYPYMYGYSPKMWKNGVYRYDERQNRLIFGDGCDTVPGAEIMVEYNAAMDNEQYNLIPLKMYDTLRHRVAMMIKANKQPSIAEWEERRFKKEYRLLKSTYSTYTLEDLVAALRGQYSSTVKR